jgi:hypothetical protein
MNPQASRPNLAGLVAALALASLAGMAGASTKDIVIDQLRAPLLAPATARPAADAMAVSVLVESPDGTLMPRSTAVPFRTGERFRVKVITGRDGRIALYNTRPDGVTGSQPVWSGPVRAGEELITQRLRIDGQSGTDLLHVVLEPTLGAAPAVAAAVAPVPAATVVATPAAAEPSQAGRVWNWLRRVLGINDKGVADAGATKDIVLDTLSTGTATYVSNPRGDGLTTTITIQHSR